MTWLVAGLVFVGGACFGWSWRAWVEGKAIAQDARRDAEVRP